MCRPESYLLITVLLLSQLPIDSVTDSVNDSVNDVVYYPFLMYIEALEPHSIDRVLIPDRPFNRMTRG